MIHSSSKVESPSTTVTSTKDDQSRLKECPICTSTVSSYSKSPRTCQTTHDRACSECWEVHLSTEVKTKTIINFQCLFCPSRLAQSDFERLSRKATLSRYQKKVLEFQGRKCMARYQGTSSLPQPFDRETIGRVFTCTFCSFAVCTDCDRPEHVGEACSEFQARTTPLQNPATGMSSSIQCPACHTYGEVINSSCGYMECKDHSTSPKSGGCGHRYCRHCLVPWVGAGSHYLLGATAHASTCWYFSKLDNSIHGVKNRFGLNAEGRARENAKKARRRESTRKSKLKRGPEKLEDGVDGKTGQGGDAGGKKRRISKSKVVDSDAEDDLDADPLQSTEADTLLSKPVKVNKLGKKAAGEPNGPKQPRQIRPETTAKREKTAIRREKRKGLEQKKREMQNPSAEMLAAWEEHFGSKATWREDGVVP